MQSIGFLLFITLFCLTACSDNTDKIEKYIADNASPLTSISPESNNFDDLEVIGNAIGSKRLVLLGEQDHGDANTFLAKTRLIKYLHQHKGFTRVLFEEDLASLLLHDKYQITSPQTRINNTLDDYWLKCEAFQPLISYLSTSFAQGNPLTYSGMDIYIDGNASIQLLQKELILISEQNPQMLLNIFFQKLITFYEYSSKRNLKAVGRVKITDLSNQFDQAFSKLELNNEQEVIFQNIKAYIDSLLATYGATIRDKQMANNILWYLKNYPDEKVIVWTANTHAAKNAWESVTGEFGRRRSMGEHLYKQVPNELYSIGTISNGGTFGRIGQELKSIQKPPSTSLESWFKSIGSPFSFLDLSDFDGNQPNYNSFYYAKGMSHNLEKGQWHKIYDGILYIEKMKSCLQ